MKVQQGQSWASPRTPPASSGSDCTSQDNLKNECYVKTDGCLYSAKRAAVKPAAGLIYKEIFPTAGMTKCQLPTLFISTISENIQNEFGR